MPLREWLRPPRHLLVMFLAVTLLLTVTLIWLSWQLVRQDEALAEQRIEERRESAADLATAALQKSLLQAEEQLTALSTIPADELPGKATQTAMRLGADSVAVIFRPEGMEAFPSGRLPFQPTRPPTAQPGRDPFARAETLEFVREDYGEAAATLRELARARDPTIRAGALMRLARVLRKSARPREALSAYDDLAALGPAPVESIPADLVARHARLALLEELGDRERLTCEASALYAELQAGRRPLLRAEYGFYLEEAKRRLGPGDPWAGTAAAVARASAVEALWDLWQAVRNGGEAGQGRRVLWFSDRPVLVLWRATLEKMAGLAIGPDDVATQWLTAFEPTLAHQGVRILLTDTGGRPVTGRPADKTDRQSLRLASTTSLPWNVHAITADARAGNAYFDARRRVLFSLLLFIALLILAGTYFIWRVTARELAVSRLQADFVSAVSHEFRTPLTALRQFSELLAGGRVASEQDRGQYYEAMAHESRRLGRLVERLLNFGRMEAGALQYRFEPLDPAALLRDTVAEFERGGDARGHRIELNADGPAQPVRADRETLGCAVWNLLDNAVKYSSECSTVWVALEQHDQTTAIRVRDRGIGIDPEEQEDIFRKFFRGAGAKVGSIRGTGIGLAVARQIVSAHGGQILLESKPGEGSAFTILLPTAS